MDNEIPIGARGRVYRLFEMLPAAINFGMLGVLCILAVCAPRVAAWCVIAVVGVMLLRAVRGAIDMVRGYRRLTSAEHVSWRARLSELEDPRAVLARGETTASGLFETNEHLRALRKVARDPEKYPNPREIVNAVIVAAYNEPYEVIEPTIRALASSSIGAERLAVFFAYEERGGAQIRSTVLRLQREFGEQFLAFEPVMHPAHLPDEIPGKGANISFAGYALARWSAARGISPQNVLVTTLDCDNVPHRNYFACLTYAYVVQEDRSRTSFQPISIFTGNIWDAPAPARVIASGNTFWNIIASVRPLTLRNFASHSQPLDALIEMGFWSKRTIVEDGHQYWRSYFHFRGDYQIKPIPVPIYQDAVLADSYRETMVAQLKQLSRWSYGASDIPYVAVRVFGRRRQAPFWPSLWRFLTLLDSQVTLASVPIIIAIGAWLPLLLAGSLVRGDTFIQGLPTLIGTIQQFAMLGLVLSVLLAWQLLPPRPAQYGPVRNVSMIAQWLLFPITSLVFTSFTALHSQACLLLGRYREQFDVTAKAKAQESVRASVDSLKESDALS